MNNDILKNKTALITGAAKNLGRAIAIDLAKQGINIIVHYGSSKSEAETTLHEVQKYSNGILIQADVTNEDDIKHLFQTASKQLASPDVLVNLVGNFIYEPITTTSFETFKDVIETNLYHTFLTCKEALPSMQKKNWGRIINFGCTGADRITIREKTTPYYIAKTGVIMLTKVLAAEYANDGITINSISPGILQTSIAKPPTPSGKYAQFIDIINGINFLLRDESQYINGANIEISGGLILGYS